MEILYLTVLFLPILIAVIFSFGNPKRTSVRIARKLYLSIMFIFLYVPIVVLIIFSFNSSRSSGIWNGFSLKWYGELLNDSMIMNALGNTLFISLTAAVLATLLGSFGAIGIFYMKRVPKTILMNITYLPVLNADIITGISLLLLFNFISLPLGYISILIAHVCFNIPYVILSVMPKLKQMDKDLYEAALDLGATPLNAIRKVIIPEIMPGIITGFLLSVTLSVDDFVISFFTSGPVVSTLSIEIYSMTKRGITPKINALSTIIFVAVLIVLIIVNLKNSKHKKLRAGKTDNYLERRLNTEMKNKSL